MRDQILQRNWRQGAVFKASEIPDNVEWAGGRKAKHLCLVLPYSCAVVNDNTNDEPSVEVVRLSKEKTPTPHWRHAQHPRNIVIPISNSETGVEEFWRARMADRFQLPKEALAAFSPSLSYSISAETLDILISWVTKRYTRIALPDEFVELCADSMEGIHSHVQELAENESTSGAIDSLHGIYIRLSNEQDFFELDFLLLTAKLDLEESESLALDALHDFISKSFSHVDGVELDRVEIRSTFDVSVAEIEQYRQLEYDHISFETGM